MREAKRFFIRYPVSPAGCHPSILEGTFFLEGAEHNHLANVLRLRVGDKVIVVCGDEFDYHCRIESITKSRTDLILIKKELNTSNPYQIVTVYMGVIKHENLAFAVEKLNEIGATELVLFRSTYSQNIPVKLDKLQIIAEQSCKQCGRSIPLAVRGVISFDELPRDAILADPTPSPLAASMPAKGNSLVIGPEGGLTDTEREQFRNRISLCPRILRAETAAIVGAALILFSSTGTDKSPLR